MIVLIFTDSSKNSLSLHGVILKEKLVLLQTPSLQ